MPDKLQESPAQTDCKHHWKIEPANGEKSLGVCELCGAEHYFQNWSERHGFGMKKKQNAPHSY